MYYSSTVISYKSRLFLVLDTKDKVLEVINYSTYDKLRRSGIKFNDLVKKNDRLYLNNEVYIDLTALKSSYKSEFDNLFTAYSNIHIDCSPFIKKEELFKDSNISLVLVKEGRGSFSVIDMNSGKLQKLDKAQLIKIGLKHGIKGVTFEGRKLVSANPIPYSQLTNNPKIDYAVLKFFNHMIVELGDIPNEVEHFVDCVKFGMDYSPSVGGSHYDYAESLVNEYNSIKNLLPAVELYNAYNGISSPYTDVFNLMNSSSQRRSTSEDVYDKLLSVAGLPTWYKPMLKEDLFVLG